VQFHTFSEAGFSFQKNYYEANREVFILRTLAPSIPTSSLFESGVNPGRLPATPVKSCAIINKWLEI
jgi:hypothetical protein